MTTSIHQAEITPFGSRYLDPNKLWSWNAISARSIKDIELHTEEEAFYLALVAGWAMAGAAVAGPDGAALGSIWGSRRCDRFCFAVYLKDGR